MKRKVISCCAVYATQLQNSLFLLLNRVRFDSLITQHSMRYLTQNKSSKAEVQINGFYSTNLLSTQRRPTCLRVWKPDALYLPLSGINGLHITLDESFNTLEFSPK